MARYKCPACGSSYNGRKCRECLYVPMKDDITMTGASVDAEFSGEHSRGQRNTHSQRNTRSSGKKNPAMIAVAVMVLISTVMPMLANTVLGQIDLFLSSSRRPEYPATSYYDSEEVAVPTVGEIVIDIPQIEIPEIEIPEIEIPDVDRFVEPDSYPSRSPNQAQLTDVEMPENGTVLFENAGIRIMTDWVPGEPYPGDLPIYVQNTSINGLIVVEKDPQFNGNPMRNSSLYIEVLPGETAMSLLWEDLSSVSNFYTTQQRKLSFRMEIWDADTYETILTTDRVAINFMAEGTDAVQYGVPDTTDRFVTPNAYPARSPSQTETDSSQDPAQTETAVERTVLYQTEDIVITTDWQEGEAYPGDIPVSVTNLSNRDLIVSSTNTFINDYFIEYAMLYTEVAAGQTVEDYFWSDYAGMMSAGIDTAAKMTFSLETLEQDTYEWVADSEEITLNCAVPEGFVQPVDDSGRTILDRDGLRIVCRGYGEVNGWANTVGFFLENNSQQNVVFHVSDMRLNGEYVECAGFVTLPSGTRAVNEFFLNIYLEERGIRSRSDIQSLVLQMAVSDAESYAMIQDLGWVSLDLG